MGGIDPNIAGHVHLPPNLRMSGYGRVPLDLQRQAPRSFPHRGPNPGTESKYDPEMSLEKALTGHWNSGSDRGQQAARSCRTDQIPKKRKGRRSASNITRPLSSVPAVNAGSDNWSFVCPTDTQGDFARAMSRIAADPSASSQGSLLNSNNLGEKLFSQIQLALAVKMGLNGPQEVRERALKNVLTSKSARGDMKQILQSRAEIYGDLLDPS